MVFCMWEVPGKAITIYLHPRIVGLLNKVIQDSQYPIQGTEVGGLLLGTTELDTRCQIFVRDFTPVACEYQFGPSYYLSASDKRVLKEKIAWWQPGPGKYMYVVGYYRSHNRQGFNLDEEDHAVAREYFSDPASVFLLIKPFITQVSVGGFFFSEECQIQRESNLLFPFSQSKLMRGETTLPHVPQDKRQLPSQEHAAGLRQFWPDRFPIQTPAAEWDRRRREPLAEMEEDLGKVAKEMAPANSRSSGNADEPPLSQVETVPVSRRSPWPWILSLGILIGVLATGGYQVLQKSDMPETKTVVGVDRFTDSLSAPPVTLEPQSSARATEVPGMKPAIVTEGKQVRTPKASARETAPLSPTSTSVRGGSAARAEHKSQQVKTEVAKDAQSASAPVDQAKAAPFSIAPDDSAPQKAGEIGQRAPVETPSKVVESTPPPEEIAAAQQQPMSPATIEIAKAASSPQELLVSPQVHPKTVLPPQYPGLRIDYVAPQPFHRVAPFVPSSLRRLAIADVRIDVTVHIDATGKIVRAESLSKGNTLTDYLSSLAVDAARHWQFSPARRDNQNVPSEMVLSFQFGSNAE
jgi:hypothetical protein